MPSEEVTLKELVNLRFQVLEEKVDDLRKFIEKQMEAQSAKVRELESRIGRLEDWKLATGSQLRVYRYMGGLVVAVVVALVIAWARQRLGL